MLMIVTACLLVGLTYATPPDYQSFNRDQRTDYAYDESALLRIWIVYIGQGDAILVQFPKGFASRTDEPLKMLVDGGPAGNQLLSFLKVLYPAPATTIEYVVLTHHDADHVEGLVSLLQKGNFRVTNLYHNGLASWKLGSRAFPGTQWPSNAEGVVDKEHNRGMAVYKRRPEFQDAALIKDLGQLISGFGGYAMGYDQFASAVQKARVSSFPRTHIDDLAFPASVGKIRLTPLWPSVATRGFGEKPGGSPDWSHSINGNSVVFRLDYGQFSMLFTGDLNEDSETELLQTLDKSKRLDMLHTDVLKIPHHGSGHGIEQFFRQVNPVISVASMGSKGFGQAWKHPSTKVIGWLGGPDRVYHTYIDQRAFDYSTLTEAGRRAMKETKHVLIETDGKQFRVVTVKDPTVPIPNVHAVSRGHGTRWIDAAEKPGR